MTRHRTIKFVSLALALFGAECAPGTRALAESSFAPDCSGWLQRDWWEPENSRTPGDVAYCARNNQGQDLAHPLREVVNDRFPEDTGASAARALLAAGADPNHRDRYKWTPLTYWALNGRGGYDPNQRNRSEAADEAQVRALLEAGADPNTPRRGNFRSNPASLIPPLSAGLFDVRPRGRLSAATGYSLGSMGIAPNQGWRPLHLAAAFRTPLGAIEALLEHGADPDLTIAEGQDWTALHAAGFAGRPAVIRLLLEHGADPSVVTSRRGWTPLHALAWSGGRNGVDTMDSVKLLLAGGVDPSARDSQGRTMWQIIVKRHGARLKKMLGTGQVSDESRAILARLQKAGS